MAARKLANYPPEYAALFRRAHSFEAVVITCASADEARRTRTRLYKYKLAHLDDPTFDPYVSLAAAELRFSLRGEMLIISRNKRARQVQSLLQEQQMNDNSDAAVGRNMAQLSKAERLARAVLLFFEPGPWDQRKQELWLALTGVSEATTRALGDLAREVQAQEEGRGREP